MPRERRNNFRVEWNSPAMLYGLNGRLPRPCIVSNLSNGGAKIAGVRPETVADAFLLRVSPHSRMRRCRVLWRSKDALGVEFIPMPQTAAARPTAHRARELVDAPE